MRRLVVTLVVLIGLVVLADFGSAAHAEYEISRTLRVEQQLQTDPDVRIEGFPFLTQVLGGRYSRVEVQAQGVALPGLGPVTIQATLRDVALSRGDAAAGSIGRSTAREVDSTVHIDATTLGQYFGVPDLQLSAPPADRSDGTGGSGGSGTTTDGGVVLTGTLSVPGLERQVVSVQAELSVVDANIVVRATDFALGSPGGDQTSLPEPAKEALLGQLSRTIPVGQLPFRVPPTGVRAQGSEFVLEGSGNDVSVSVPPVAGLAR